MSDSLAAPARLARSNVCGLVEVTVPRIPHAGERFLAALACARRGIPVVPLHHPVVAGQPPVVACSCQEPGCPWAGAHPITVDGVADATIDPLRITWWWRRFPAANLGLATGVGFDVLVVHGSEGDALRWSVLAAALRAGGPLVRAGGDGWVFYFAPTGAPSQRPHGLAEQRRDGQAQRDGQPVRRLRHLLRR